MGSIILRHYIFGIQRRRDVNFSGLLSDRRSCYHLLAQSNKGNPTTQPPNHKETRERTDFEYVIFCSIEEMLCSIICSCLWATLCAIRCRQDRLYCSTHTMIFVDFLFFVQLKVKMAGWMGWLDGCENMI